MKTRNVFHKVYLLFILLSKDIYILFVKSYLPYYNLSFYSIYFIYNFLLKLSSTRYIT